MIPPGLYISNSPIIAWRSIDRNDDIALTAEGGKAVASGTLVLVLPSERIEIVNALIGDRTCVLEHEEMISRLTPFDAYVACVAKCSEHESDSGGFHGNS